MNGAEWWGAQEAGSAQKVVQWMPWQVNAVGGNTELFAM